LLTNLGEVDVSGDKRVEKWLFTYNTNEWIVNKPKNYQLNANSKIREIFYRYDNKAYGSAPTKGDLTWEEHVLTSGSNPVLRYSYDGHGNLIQETDAKGVSTRYEFGITDRTFTFPERIINAKNHVSKFVYDLGTGNLLSQTDASNNVKTMVYDVFGRIIKEILPLDSKNSPTKKYSYSLDGSAPESIKISQKENQGTLDTSYFYDGFGNLIQIKTEAETSQITADFYYDKFFFLIIIQSIKVIVVCIRSYTLSAAHVIIFSYTVHNPHVKSDI